MSFPSINDGMPDPYHMFPSTIYIPQTKINHIPSSQVIGDTLTTLGSEQLISSFVIAPLIGGQSLTLPNAASLLGAYGSYRQVQVGDYFIIQVFNIGAGESTFPPGAGGTGGGAVSPGIAYLLITFTNTALGSEAYTLSVIQS